MKKRTKKLNLTRETVTNLDPEALRNLAGGACGESRIVCSIQHTCWSCNATDTCA